MLSLIKTTFHERVQNRWMSTLDWASWQQGWQEESCSSERRWEMALSLLTEEAAMCQPHLLSHGATRRGPVLSYQLLRTPELCQMETSALRSLWKPWLGKDHSGFCVGLLREVDRPIHIHPDTSCWPVTETKRAQPRKDNFTVILLPAFPPQYFRILPTSLHLH